MEEDDLYPRESSAAPKDAEETGSVKLFELSLEQTACFNTADAGSSSFDPYNSASRKDKR